MISAANSPTTRLDSETAAMPTRQEFIRAHYRFQDGRFFTSVKSADDAIHTASDVAVPMWNHSTHLGDDASLGEFLRASELWHDSHGRRPVVYLVEENEAVAAKGYERFDRETWMVRDVEIAETKGSEFAIEAASDLREFAKVFRAAFSASSAAYDQALRRDGAGTQKHLIAHLGGEAVAVGTVICEGDIACIYNVGAAPQFRGRGAGRAMMEASIRVARNEGCRWVFLQVESGSLAERLYIKLGFEPLFARTGYRKADWQAKPAAPQESALSKALGFSGRISGAGTSEGRETRALSRETAELLTQLCQRENIARAQVATGLWAALLSRYLNANEVTFRVERAEVERVRAKIGGGSALAWMKTGFTPVEETDTSIESIVSIAPRRSTLGSIALTFEERSFELTYRAELFSRSSVRRMADHFACLLESFVNDPQRKASELELLTPAERQRLLVDWSQGGTIPWKGETIVDLLESRAKQTPNATALILVGTSPATGSNARLTYAELMTRASERAGALIRAGVTRGAAVGALLPRSLEMVVSMIAIWRAGGVFVPLDTGYPADRLAFMASDSGMKVVMTNRALSALAPKEIAKVLVDSAEEARGEARPPELPDVGGENVAYVIYTSGSTGQPKGVTITHGAIARHVLAMIQYYEITAQDRHLHFSPFTFDASFEQLLPPLVAGATVVVRDERLWDVGEFISNVESFELTMADIPMAYWHQLAQYAVGLAAEKVPDRLRLVIAGGEAMATDRLAQWQQGPFGNRRLVNAYGPTEATVTATAFEAADFKAGEAGSVPIGRPLPGREAYILDGSMQPVPVRVAGQLYLGGPLLASGYLNRAELTRERFVKNPFAEGQLYATGDMARYLEDGTIEFLGRVDDQIKIRGFRVEPGEIEIALQEHPSVRDAVVVARDDGGGQKRLVGYVTPRNGKVSERAVRQWLRGRLPDYMTPSAIVALKEFPLLPSGKVNRKALPDPASNGALPAPGATPKTPLELQLQILFQRVLRRNGVGVDESFFELGGDSLQALELMVQIEKATGRRLPLESLFQTPTVQRLAVELQRSGRSDDWSCLVTLQKSGRRAPLFLVHTTPGDVLGYGNLIHHLGADQPCYGFQALGLKDGAEAHATIEGMAAHYVGLLRKFQPKGPYHLGGWCFGGIVAVEMAQQLQRAGEEVAPLLLMETISVPPGPGNVKYHAARLKCLFSMSPDRWREYLRAKAKYRRQVELDNRMRFRQAGDNVDPQQQLWLARLEQVYNANLAALDLYRSSYYAGKVILFNAVEKDPGILPDPKYGWTGLADDIEIHEVAGDHDTMLAEPNVSSLATAIRKVLS
jgi:amino acid adenylation domain-containing protein